MLKYRVFRFQRSQLSVQIDDGGGARERDKATWPERTARTPETFVSSHSVPTSHPVLFIGVQDHHIDHRNFASDKIHSNFDSNFINFDSFLKMK